MSLKEKHGLRKPTRSQRKRRLSQKSLRKRPLLQVRKLLQLQFNQKLRFQRRNQMLQTSRKKRKRRRRLLTSSLLNQKKKILQSNQNWLKKKLKNRILHFQQELVKMIWLLKRLRVEFKMRKNKRRGARHLAVRLIQTQVMSSFHNKVKGKPLFWKRRKRPSWSFKKKMKRKINLKHMLWKKLKLKNSLNKLKIKLFKKRRNN